MTLQQMEYVIALDSERNFVKAATKCFVTQPTLTMQVKKLEDEIDLMLFDITKKPLEPTSEGVHFIAQCRDVLHEVAILKQLVSSEKDSINGVFKIGIIPTLAPYIMPQFLENFNKNYPNSKLQIKEMQTLDIIKAIKSDTLDIGIMVTPLDEPALKEIPLFYEPFLFYHGKTNPFADKEKIAISDLENKTVLLLEEGHCFRNQALQICKNHSTADELGFEYCSGTIETLKNMVKRDMGFTLVPKLAINESDKGFYQTFEDPEPVREVSLVTHKSFNRIKLLQAFQDQFNATVPDSLKKTHRKKRITWR